MVDHPDPPPPPPGGYELVPPTLVTYRVIFTTGSTPPRSIRAAEVTTDPDMPGMLAFKNQAGRTICYVNRDQVLFVDERAMREIDDAGTTPQAGMARVAGGTGWAAR